MGGGVVSDVEIRARLTSLLDLLEHERSALEESGLPSLADTLEAITRLQSEVVAALEALPPPAGNGLHR
jgi:hypothetical protein